MSQVHDAIALAALSVQTNEVKKLFKPYKNDLAKSSWYPDMVKRIRTTKDARYLCPAPPKTSWQKQLKTMSQNNKLWVCCGEPALEHSHLCEYYLKNIIKSIKSGDMQSAGRG